ncbi:FAD/NAD(P)-binding protein [Novosphingobium album (ex Hu et al. 2023)]|uniref:FAD/NAD(P)-binding protein n=1 Tax=Novosphingobium album (ex Hu et al. 2023) TaxID=2930093 RepID=A0ABT0AYD3_9SPHN|nr:FAD/NAD(P)-binding protein [Novosphingobium album (ex Hu et al. 2023)]MCJ2177814.1 FAD/NAD(P)-binding protein [Novosphingobium album (ex Hu et al. 2023)]
MKDPFVPEIYRVESVRRELADAVTLELAPVSGKRPDFRPGQFNMLYAFGVGEVAISMSVSAHEGPGFVHTVRNAGAVSGALARLEPGSTLGVRGPFGTGWPVAEAEGRDVLIVAGGLGLAPLRPAIQEVLAHRERFGRVTILVGCRSPSEILYQHDLEQWKQRLDVNVEVTVDHAGTDWHGNVGFVTTLIPRSPFDPANVVAMVCGPEVMMRFAATGLQKGGVPASSIYLSMERNMKCAIGLCGHCQFGPAFICKDGPVLPLDRIAGLLTVQEV